jgi:hypothetical protein
MHEADVGVGRLGDQLGDALGQRLELQSGGDRVDDTQQQPALTRGVRQTQPDGAAQWNTPSRRATAIA